MQSRRSAQAAAPCSYNAAHHRVARARGTASGWRCACGAMATQWAYRGGSDNEIRGTRTVRQRGRVTVVHSTWSPDPGDYAPMCRTCHGRHDRPDYLRGYRHDIDARETYLARQRERERRRWLRIKADAAALAAYRARKRRESHRRKTHSQPDS